MTRTEEYENHLERIQKLRKLAFDARTAARAYDDYAEILKNLPTLGAIADDCREVLIAYAKKCADDMRKLIDSQSTLADRLEAGGLGS